MSPQKPHGNSKIHQRKRLLGAIRVCFGDLSAVARRLKVDRKTVYVWIKKDGLAGAVRKARREALR